MAVAKSRLFIAQTTDAMGCVYLGNKDCSSVYFRDMDETRDWERRGLHIIHVFKKIASSVASSKDVLFKSKAKVI